MKFTIAPAIGAPFWSLTTMEGAGETGLPATPDSDVAEFAVIVVGTEGSTAESPLQAMYASRSIAEVSLNLERVDRAT
jgi:hypothetical protein